MNRKFLHGQFHNFFTWNGLRSFSRVFLVFSLLLAMPCAWAKRQKVASAPLIIQSEQDIILKKEVLDFLRLKSNRKAGEGLLFLANHHLELGEDEKALFLLKQIVETDRIDKPVKYEAQLLRVKILQDNKEYDSALKELQRLFSWQPDQATETKAKVACGQILGRGMTRFEDLLKAYRRFYSKFPEVHEEEELKYLMGFERGYDLEIGMKGLEAWEEVSKLPDLDASDLGKLNVALMYAFDLQQPQKGMDIISGISHPPQTVAASDSIFVQAVLTHHHLPEAFRPGAEGLYQEYRSRTSDLLGYRVSTLMLGNLLTQELNAHEQSLESFNDLATVPLRLIATASISLKKRREVEDEDRYWALLGYKMAGYTAEYKMKDSDRARYYYQKAFELDKIRFKDDPDFWLVNAVARTEPKLSQPQILFDKAFEKYRGRNIPAALELFEKFLELYPNNQMAREARYRTAVIMDDDLKRYDRALELYHQYIISSIPKKSKWKLDVLYDFGRIDEVHYRVGNLLALHKKDPLGAIKVFSDLLKAHPESSWSMQGLKDSIRLYREMLGDENSAQASMKQFILSFPEAKDSQKYRRDLFERLLGQNENTLAVIMLREYLDHSLPSEKDYLTLKQQWRDLSFRIREEALRKQLEIVGKADRESILFALVPVLSLASTTAPLESFSQEIPAMDISDEVRWKVTYKIGKQLFSQNPQKAKNLFESLTNNATGPVKLACILTLANIAYRVDKSIPDSIRLYETAIALANPGHPWLETPTYRLGRLYLASEEGIKGIDQLELFLRRFPRSHYLAKAYLALGNAFAALHHPEQARRFYEKVLRLSPKLKEKVDKLLESLESISNPEEWLKSRKETGSEQRAKEAIIGAAEKVEVGILPENLASATIDYFYNFTPEQIYPEFVERLKKPNADRNLLNNMLISILMREESEEIIEKAQRHYISLRLFRFRDVEAYANEAQQILTFRNYPKNLSELLYRYGFSLEFFEKKYEKANKTYFEYLSFFPNGKRASTVRERIPQVYEKLEDVKNALRFYSKLIEDPDFPPESRVDASIRKARIQEIEQGKEEGVKTLEAALAFDSERKPEILLRLERLTDNFEYVTRALDSSGSEKHRLIALKRVIKKAEKDLDFATADKNFQKYRDSFTENDSLVWIEKKASDLGQRGLIQEIERKIERFPEELETPSRLFKLANIVEGMEDTKYQSQDLFYEITLVYPHSQFFRESKIRAENIRAIRSIQEMGTALKKGAKDEDAAELMLERAKLYRDSLKSMPKALEDYEAMVKLFPESPLLDEAYLGLGDIALSHDNSAQKAQNYWEIGLSKSHNPEIRQKLIQRINDLRIFHEKVLFSEDREDQEEGENLILRIWRLEKDPTRALGLLNESLGQMENRPHAARFHYLTGRIHEEAGNWQEANQSYEKALRSLYHPGCRKDRVLYRMARIFARNGQPDKALDKYKALIWRYPKSLLSRSAYYNLYKSELKAENYTKANNYLDLLLQFRSLVPQTRSALEKEFKDLTAKMNLKEMARLQKFSMGGSNPAFHYFIAKVLEYDLQDYDRAVDEYAKYLKSNPPVVRAREVLEKMADLAERKGDTIAAITYLDNLRKTFKPAPEQFNLVLKIGDLVEDGLANPELSNLYYENIAVDYEDVPSVRNFARAKIRRIEEKKLAKVERKKGPKGKKREYSEEDQEVLDFLKEIVDKYIDDLQDFTKAEREMVSLWDDYPDSAASLDVMKALVELNEEQLSDPQMAGEYYQRWLDENPQDSMYDTILMSLYNLYMDKTHEGQKALRLLEDFIRTYPNSPIVMEAELKLGKANELLVKNWDEARRTYQRLIDTKRNDPIVHEAYFRMGLVMREGFADYQSAIILWDEMNNLFYQNSFAEQAQFAVAFTYEAYLRDFTKARENYEKLLNLYPNSSLQNQVREALLRISGKR